MQALLLNAAIAIIARLAQSGLLEILRTIMLRKIDPKLLEQIEQWVGIAANLPIPGAEKLVWVHEQLRKPASNVNAQLQITAGYLVNWAIESAVVRLRLWSNPMQALLLNAAIAIIARLAQSGLLEILRTIMLRKIDPKLLEQIEQWVGIAANLPIPGAEKLVWVHEQLRKPASNVNAQLQITAGYLVNWAIESAVVRLRLS